MSTNYAQIRLGGNNDKNAVLQLQKLFFYNHVLLLNVRLFPCKHPHNLNMCDSYFLTEEELPWK